MSAIRERCRIGVGMDKNETNMSALEILQGLGLEEPDGVVDSKVEQKDEEGFFVPEEINTDHAYAKEHTYNSVLGQNEEYIKNTASVSRELMSANVVTSSPRALKLFGLGLNVLNNQYDEGKFDENAPLEVEISKNELYKYYKLENTKDRFKILASDLKMAVTESVFFLDDKIWSLYSNIDIKPSRDSIIVRYNQDLKEHVTSLATRNIPFMQYSIYGEIELKAIPTIRLYELFDSLIRQYWYYKTGQGKIRQTDHQLDLMIHPTFTYEDHRNYVGIDDDGKVTRKKKKLYPQASIYTRDVVKKSAEQITEKTHINVEFETLKDGRKTSGYKYSISYKKDYLDELLSTKGWLSTIDAPYKSYEEMSQGISRMPRAEQESLVGKAMFSSYTTTLKRLNILSEADASNPKILASLAAYVYKQYDELAKMKGTSLVERHLKRIATYREGTTEEKSNIVGYLSVSIDNYLAQLKAEDALN